MNVALRGIVAAVALALMASADAASAQDAAVLTAQLQLPESVALGGELLLDVRVTNHGTQQLVAREGVLDATAFEFQVQFDNQTESRYTAWHPGAGQGSMVAGLYLEPGAELRFQHPVPALKVGRWSFRALYHGVPALGVIASPKRVVNVLADEQGATDLGFRITTAQGAIACRLWPEFAPSTALHVASLVRDRFYDGTPFHRVIQGFMIQGGAKGEGGAGYTIPAEFNAQPHREGVLSMARFGDPLEQDGHPPRDKYRDSARTSFFICAGEAAFLDGRYTAFGEVVEGLGVVQQIAAGEVQDDGYGEVSEPLVPVVMTEVRLIPLSPPRNKDP